MRGGHRALDDGGVTGAAPVMRVMQYIGQISVLMRRIVFVALLGVAIALLTWALAMRGKEGMLIFFLGADILLCTLVVGGLRFSSEMFSKGKTPTTNTSAILGALIGLFIGGIVGARSDLGRVVISVFNPDLPEQDFGTSFGAIGGGILGAFFLALVSGLLRMLIVRPEKAVPVESSEDSVPDSRGDTA
jgi:hypothetical protein